MVDLRQRKKERKKERGSTSTIVTGSANSRTYRCSVVGLILKNQNGLSATQFRGSEQSVLMLAFVSGFHVNARGVR